MTEDLKMTGDDYNIALLVFFIPYILFEVPSNIIIKRVAPSFWLAGIMFLWGVATIGQGLIKTNGGLVAMRVLLGLFEAGFFPGCESYLLVPVLSKVMDKPLILRLRYVFDIDVL